MPRYITKKAFLAERAGAYPDTAGALNWLLFRAPSNGLQASGAIRRFNGRVLLDPEAFDRWIAENSEPARGAA